MKRKNIFIISIATVLVLAGALATYTYIQNLNTKKSGILQNGNFTLDYSYQGDNTWSYTVVGTLPTPCYDVTAKAIVAESYPEQVKILVQTQEQSDGYVCATVIHDFNYTNTFKASPKAVITLDVE